jgi:hypothetical protein
MSVIPSTGNRVFNDDNTPPVTTCTLDPPNPNGCNNWYVSNVNVTLNATDDESGVNVTYYKIDDGEWNIYNDTFIVSKDGIHVIYFYSVDNAGNIEDVKTGGFAIDQTDPCIDFLRIIRGLPERPMLEFTAIVQDKTSGIDRVELYFNSELIDTRYEHPYVFNIYPPCEVKVRGFIFPPSFSTDYVSFFGIYVRASVYWDDWWETCGRAYDRAGNYADDCMGPPGILQYTFFLKHLYFTNNYTGGIGLFYINAIFKYGWEYYE